MPKVAVVAHAGKTMGGGLEELRQVLALHGVSNPYWSEVPKSRHAPKRVRRALKEGAELVFVWGGDGMVQRSVDVLAGTGVPLAILPAGTANLFASSMDLPGTVAEAVEVGLYGADRQLDVGKLNDECFAVMAGAGLDAQVIREADGGMKDRLGRLAYVWTASKHLRGDPFKARIEVNGELWYKGQASCVLLGNVGSLFAGVDVFENARPDDGFLELGVTNAEGLGEWARTMAHAVLGSATRSPFVQVTKAQQIDVELDRKVPYELDGGERGTAKRLGASVAPRAITVRVSKQSTNGTDTSTQGKDADESLT
jgi:diacylglycerol kinase family enzyme